MRRAEQAEARVSELEARAGAGGWIKTADRLPDVGAEVECFVVLCDREIRCFMKREAFQPLITFRGNWVDGELALSSGYVKYWRDPVPLPEAPSEKGEG